jgi:hypothetical protein
MVQLIILIIFLNFLCYPCSSHISFIFLIFHLNVSIIWKSFFDGAFLKILAFRLRISSSSCLNLKHRWIRWFLNKFSNVLIILILIIKNIILIIVWLGSLLSAPLLHWELLAHFIVKFFWIIAVYTTSYVLIKIYRDYFVCTEYSFVNSDKRAFIINLLSVLEIKIALTIYLWV